MRKQLQKLYFLLGVLLVASPLIARADEVTDDQETPALWRLHSLRVGAAKLRTSLSNDPDTIWIGHIADPAWVPKDRDGTNVPSSARDADGAPMNPGTVPVGGYGPHHVGRGENLPGGDVSSGVAGGAGTHFNGVWDFDHYQAGDDSLQGWWPVARPGQSEGAGNTEDKVRAFFALSYGNNGNFVMNMGSNKRTFGVTGYWHRDAGNLLPNAYVDGTPLVPGPNVEWTPINGTQSAWCGLRAEQDYNAIDQKSLGGTGNPINQLVLQYNGNNSFNQTGSVNAQNATDKNFPGYGSQWDQILYRDVNVSSVNVGDNLIISFSYIHALSPERGGTSTQRVGYFWKDPLKATKGIPNDGNYIAASEAELSLSGPVDSFTVTLGVPIDIQTDVLPGLANDFVASDGASYNIYDPQRRWFSEVIATNNQPMVELLSRSRFSTTSSGTVRLPDGTPAEQSDLSITILRNPTGTVTQKNLNALINATGGRIRIAFRVVTNRGSDDEDNFTSGFTSSTRGAAIVDDVVIKRNAAGTNLITNGDFEAENSIDNTVNPVVSVVANGSTTVTSAGLFGSVSVGSTVTGQNIPAGTTVSAKANNSSITISNAATALSGSATVTLYFNMSTALAAWKSTGKPPGVYPHVHCINSGCTMYTPAIWNDPCSPPNLLDPTAINRNCNMVGNILSAGNHDQAEKLGGTFGANDQDRQEWAISPTIITATDQANASHYNAFGLNKDIMANSTEWALWFDIHQAGFRGSGVNGLLRSIGLQSWPAMQANGAQVWGETKLSTAISFNTSNGCAPNFVSVKQAGFIGTSNASGVPDSIRAYIHFICRCYTTTLTSTTCSPTSGQFVGSYVDNISFSILHGVILAGLSCSPWMWYTDAFPTYVDPATGNGRLSFAASDFDTAAALVKIAINRTASITSLTRPNVPGDSAQVTSGSFPSFGRLDLVFRILPGPGNYTVPNNKLSALKQVPTSNTPAVGNANSTNFWENYMGNTGSFGTGGLGGPTLPVTATNINTENGGVPHDPDGPGGIAAGTVWDWNAWNSARMDTLERNLWPALSNSNNLAANSGGTDWQTTYNELDPRFVKLGVAKNRCFLANPTAGQAVSCKSKTPASTSDCNVVCQLLPGASPFGVFPPTWATAVTGGYPPAGENGLAVGKTYEFTKIIPDGQLTPGSHVQYFFRRFPGQFQNLDIWPDTTQIFDGPTADGGRWYNFSVLPDNWKKSAYGGLGLRCMLVVDNYDRQGDEFFWVSAADSIGLTESGKRGANNGWYAAGGVNDLNTFSQATLRRDNGGQPGTLWDLWNVKAGESQVTGGAWLSNRLTTQPAAGSFMEGKTATTGPGTDMLRTFYQSIIYLTGTAVGTNFGAVPDRGDDDFAQLNDFALLPTSGVRSVLVWGSGFCEDLTTASTVPVGGAAFLASFFGTSLTNPAYRTYSGNVARIAHYDENPGSAHDLAGAQSGLTYGVLNGCGIENDVLKAEPAAAAGAAVQTFSENVGSFGPYPASVYVPAGGTGSSHPQITMLDGTRINRVTSYAALAPGGKRNFLFNVLKDVAITAGAVGCSPLASPVGVGDDPITGSSFVNFLKLRSSNPMHSGEARLAFGLAKSEKVEVRVYDVTGRAVKTVANRVFAGGQEHVVVWDGTDEAGNKVRSGVYFYQLKTPTWTSQKKLAVLSN